MPRSCAACSSSHRKEIDRRLRSGTHIIDVVRWLRDAGESIGRNALARHASNHVGIVTKPGPRPTSDDFLEAVRDAAADDLRSGATRPTITHGLMAQKQIDERTAKFRDQSLMLRIALVLTGNVGYIDGEAREVSPEQEALEAEFRQLLEPGVVEPLEDFQDRIDQHLDAMYGPESDFAERFRSTADEVRHRPPR